MRRLGTLAFQTDPAGAGAPAGGSTYESIAAQAETPPAADPTPAVDPASPPVSLPAGGEAGETQAWEGPSQQEWEAQQQYLQQTAPFLNELQQLLAEDQGQPGYAGQE